MPQYLVQVAYTSEAVAALVNNPHDRFAEVTRSIKKLGGKVVDGWMTFGEYDVTLVIALPDNVAAAAFSMAIGAGGACKSVKTTPLLSIDDGVKAMKIAATLDYRPPTA